VSYVDAGYFVDDYILESAPVIIRRGDDAGTIRRFWEKRAQDWIDDNLERLHEAKKAKAKRRVIQVIIESAAAMESPPVPIAALAGIKSALRSDAPDYTAIAAELIAVLEQKRRAIRKRRDIEALLVLGW
jgi:hypothetical protein